MSKNLIQNGDFKDPQLSSNSFNYYVTNPKTYWPVPAWFFYSGALINNSTAWGYPTPYPNGNNQAVSIQDMAYIYTTMNLKVSTNYILSFWACGRDCCTDTKVNPILIELFFNYGGKERLAFIYTITPPINKWTQYSLTITTPVTSNCKLKFSGTKSYGDHSSAITNISLVESVNNVIQNGDFDIPQVSPNSYTRYNNYSVPAWFFNNAFVINNSEAWGYPMPYPNGNQQAVSLQMLDSIHQDVYLQPDINYTLSLWACGRYSWDFCTESPIKSPYLNKVVAFTTSPPWPVCYVTWKGVVRWIPNYDIWKSLNISQTIQSYINLPFNIKATPGTQIPTNPSLIIGKPMEKGENIETCSGVNPIDIKLFNKKNQLISYISQINPHMSRWNCYSFRFTVPSSEAYILKFSGTKSFGDHSSAITHIILSQESRIPSSSCNYIMNNTELSCYKANYPDLSALNNEQLQYHWSNTGCKQNRNNQCPSYEKNVGQYEYIGCYGDMPNRAIPNYRGGVSSPIECMKIAEKNYENIFGLQDADQCFTGTDIDSAKKYGPKFDKSICPQMGGPWTNQIYVRNKPFIIPPPNNPPILSQSNFNTQ
jgi:hypothetical protein